MTKLVRRGKHQKDDLEALVGWSATFNRGFNNEVTGRILDVDDSGQPLVLGRTTGRSTVVAPLTSIDGIHLTATFPEDEVGAVIVALKVRWNMLQGASGPAAPESRNAVRSALARLGADVEGV